MKIEHVKAASQMREDFMDMHRQATRIQTVFRSFRVRKHYRKIIWSVEILEKAIFRWLLKRKGFRGLEVQRYPAPRDKHRESDVYEDFFQANRKQAEARLKRSILPVQAMFRSKKVQEDYRRFGG